MDPDLDRLVSEDEAARVDVDRSASAAHARVEAEERALKAQRRERLVAREREVAAAVAAVAGDADRECLVRAARRDAAVRDQAVRADAIFADAVETYVRIVRGGAKPPPDESAGET